MSLCRLPAQPGQGVADRLRPDRRLVVRLLLSECRGSGRLHDRQGRLAWESEKLYKLVRELAPNIMVNDRIDLRAPTMSALPSSTSRAPGPRIAGATAWSGSVPDLQRLLGIPSRRGLLAFDGRADPHADRLRQQGRQPPAERRSRPVAVSSMSAPEPSGRHRRVDEAPQPLDLRLHGGAARSSRCPRTAS